MNTAMPLRRVAHGLGAFLGAALLCATAATAQAGAVPADQSASEASVAPVTCGNHTNYFRIWTKYHGFPACFHYTGFKSFSPTWTSYGICAGAYSGYVNYIVDGVEIGDQFTAGNCIDWSRTYGTVEVVGFKLTNS
ncbi:hypothetical protein [Streptomyces sp. TP-A0356]|uniref:hypothetical protein n=1 Tax=Streptomyces sp. TP-A0356 TaxID=1359208 RepID=UPI000A497679|nr:hypothetical protein [Streptomyces sp. TP-A0356]